MDAAAMAEILGTDAKTLRRFIRSADSTFSTVGSGGRYVFEESDVPVFRKKFPAWQAGQGKPARDVKQSKPTLRASEHEAPMTQADKDRAVWEEEGPVCVPDIKDPRILARVKACAKQQERELERMLRAAGLHVSQMKGAPRVSA